MSNAMLSDDAISALILPARSEPVSCCFARSTNARSCEAILTILDSISNDFVEGACRPEESRILTAAISWDWLGTRSHVH